ncbi:MAG TPA: 3-phosphoshikimate 1-carboxyvinyltransferase, partial [Blastocatellia bacterium]|nr:3-phosphoshikimate 1-carboxyvinyltransferase [Blastocatellia bacterium]
IRMLSGLLAGHRFNSRISGDQSLNKRPMRRIIDPLSLMGAKIEARDGNFPPLTIFGDQLHGIRYESPVASAQVKTCVLLAGLLAGGETVFLEPVLSRNHTELMLNEFGVRLLCSGDGPREIRVQGGSPLSPVQYTVPGDLSSAAFFIAAAAMDSRSRLVLENVGLNPTRAAFLDVVTGFGARIETANVTLAHGEQVGDIKITGGGLRAAPSGGMIRGQIIPNIIDEIPILAVLATQVEGRTEVRDAAELRIKESDRIRAVAAGIRALGGTIEEFDDGFAITGPQHLTGGSVDAHGDHRIAMAFSIAGLAAHGTTHIIGAECASVSFPEFYALLSDATPEGTVEYIS